MEEEKLLTPDSDPVVLHTTQEVPANYIPTRIDYVLPIIVIILTLVIDQIIKVYVKTNFELGQDKTLFEGWGYLHFIENNGIAFGTEFGGKIGKYFLTIFRIIASGGIMWYLLNLIKRGYPKGIIISISLIFAGAFGNIIDSLFYGIIFKDINEYEGGFLLGKVVDMFYFPLWQGFLPDWIPLIGGSFFTFFEPVFNFADAAISVGVILILLFFRKAIKSA